VADLHIQTCTYRLAYTDGTAATQLLQPRWFNLRGPLEKLCQEDGTIMTSYGALDGRGGYATPDTISYVEAQPDITYPPAEAVTTFGPVWAPRLYAHGLSTIEVGSSGKIALSLADVHALDISRAVYRSPADYVNSIVALSNDSLRLQTGDSNVRIVLDALDHSAATFATGTVRTLANSNYEVTALAGASMYARDGQLRLGTNGSNTFLALDSATGDVLLTTTPGSVGLHTSNHFLAQAARTAAVRAGEDVRVTSETARVSLQAATDIDAAATAGNVAVTAGHHVRVQGGGDVRVDAQTGTLEVTASHSNARIAMGYSVDAYAASNVVFLASNNWVAAAKGSASLYAGEGHIKLATSASNTHLTLESTTGDAVLATQLGSVRVSTSNDVHLRAGGDVHQVAESGAWAASASACNVCMVMRDGAWRANALSGFRFDTPARYELATTSNACMYSAEAVWLGSADSNAFVEVTKGAEVSLHAASNITATSGGGVVLNAASDVTAHAHSNISIRAGQGLRAVVDDGNFAVRVGDSNTLSVNRDGTAALDVRAGVGVVADGDFAVATLSNARVDAGKTLQLRVKGGQTSVSMSDLQFQGYAADSLVLTAGSNLTLASAQSWRAFAHDSNMSITMDHASDSLALISSNAIVVDSANTIDATSTYVQVLARSNASVRATRALALAASNVSITACNYALNSGDFAQHTKEYVLDTAYTRVYADSNIDFFVRTPGTDHTSLDHPVFSISSNVVRIVGDIELSGQLNAINASYSNINVSTTNLRVQDKSIKLAFNDDEETVDGLQNNEAGIVVAGTPSNLVGDDSTPEAYYRKAFTWNAGVDGITSLGTSNLEREAFWNLEGGSLRLTKKRVEGGSVIETAFGLRVNDHDELEVVKKWFNTATSNYQFVRVARFGRLLT
jgi:hypothetical protein